MSHDDTLALLAAKVEAFIASRDLRESSFEAMAREVFEFQFAQNPAYRRFCESQGLKAPRVENWAGIPAVITSAFKAAEWTVLPPAQRVRVFYSSGTTAQQRSKHFHSADTLRLYEKSLLAWFTPHVLPDTAEFSFAFLAPPPAVAPHSSLVHMFQTVAHAYGPATWHASVDSGSAWILDAESLAKEIRKTAQPVVVCGAAFSFVHLHDWLAARGQTLELPRGSRAFETGGYKGRSRTVSKEELHRMISRALSLPDQAIVAEYGMSELSSQAYDRAYGSPGGRSFRFPPWARATIVSPETGRPAPNGEPGLLRVCDLANVGSVMAIQTEDLAVLSGDGFELLGRAAQAEPRGCSLMPAA